MSLEEYKKKRNIRKTPEPMPDEAKTKARSGELVYVIQRHQASHLHYDLRLEENGVLKSWAIPKIPLLEKGVKRLAVQTEDHPLGYEDFEGIIPEGEYGAGTVETWDRGVYLPVELTPSKRVITIKGEKLKGRYCLVKLRAKWSEDKNWLFFKLKD